MTENQATDQNASEPFILFELAGTTYGVRSQGVQQVELLENITPVPNAPPPVEGVIFSRGQVIPAINLRVRFGFEKRSHDLRTRLIVVSVKGRAIGLIVDSAREFISIPVNAIQPPNEAISGLKGRYLEGIATLGGRIILILDMNEVVDLAEAMAAAPEGA
ncbi:MAG TPA: chemotaxis protein CheW [Blastocatellia bacterium]|jgi:purine-binding chemotaxis protein CheW|nr:chemotaxis protein CheW [Blastocatellia bacterium]